MTSLSSADIQTVDLLIYGATSAGVTAGIQAEREGRLVLVRAGLAMDQGCGVQELGYADLKKRLLAAGQKLK